MGIHLGVAALVAVADSAVDLLGLVGDTASHDFWAVATVAAVALGTAVRAAVEWCVCAPCTHARTWGIFFLRRASFPSFLPGEFVTGDELSERADANATVSSIARNNLSRSALLQRTINRFFDATAPCH